MPFFSCDCVGFAPRTSRVAHANNTWQPLTSCLSLALGFNLYTNVYRLRRCAAGGPPQAHGGLPWRHPPLRPARGHDGERSRGRAGRERAWDLPVPGPLPVQHHAGPGRDVCCVSLSVFVLSVVSVFVPACAYLYIPMHGHVPLPLRLPLPLMAYLRVS